MKTVAVLWLCVARLYRQVLVDTHGTASSLWICQVKMVTWEICQSTQPAFSLAGAPGGSPWWFTLVVHLLGIGAVIFQLGTGGQPVALGSRSVARLERALATLDAPRCASPRPSLGGGWRRCHRSHRVFPWQVLMASRKTTSKNRRPPVPH